MKAERILVQLRSHPEDIIFVGQDEGGLFLRRLWIGRDGKGKSQTIPITAGEIVYLTTFTSTEAFKEIIDGQGLGGKI